MLRFVFISDIHSNSDFDVPGGDVLVNCGDSMRRGGLDEIEGLLMFMERQPHRHKLLIGGNHDQCLAVPEVLTVLRKRFNRSGIRYLEGSSYIIDGVKCFGSPWTAEIPGQYYGWAFNFKNDLARNGAHKVWGKIPGDTDVLITHTPPHNILDLTPLGDHYGDRDLLERVEIVRPTIHAFGHVHHSHGTAVRNDILFVNAAICGINNKPAFDPIVVDYIGKHHAVVI